MDEGVSWSGHERNCAYLGLGEGRFADASYPSGLDFHDDGRAVATTDWDGDGDLDLWFKNRTGPQLRFTRNDSDGAGHFLAFQLQGSSSNRDAIGATVEVHAAGRIASRTVTAGDGYLSQSSGRLHFGLGQAETVDRVTVRWPGGDSERLLGVTVDRLHHVVQGTGKAIPVEIRPVKLADAPAAEPAPAKMTPVLLKVPLQLPPTLKRVVYGEAEAERATLINLWAHWCEPCLTELADLTDRHAELAGAGLDVVPISIDRPEDRERAAKMFEQRFASRVDGAAFRSHGASAAIVDLFEVLLRHVLKRPGEIALPTSLLVDKGGSVQLIYLGPVGAARLLEDKRRYLDVKISGSRRSLAGGRWYYRTPRDFMGLATDLKRRGLREDARFYLALGSLSGSGSRDSTPRPGAGR